MLNVWQMNNFFNGMYVKWDIYLLSNTFFIYSPHLVIELREAVPWRYSKNNYCCMIQVPFFFFKYCQCFFISWFVYFLYVYLLVWYYLVIGDLINNSFSYSIGLLFIYFVLTFLWSNFLFLQMRLWFSFVTFEIISDYVFILINYI